MISFLVNWNRFAVAPVSRWLRIVARLVHAWANGGSPWARPAEARVGGQVAMWMLE
jgi:hypothetical protein